MKLYAIPPETAEQVFRKFTGRSHKKFREFLNYMAGGVDEPEAIVCLKIERGYPHVKHFFLVPQKRNADNARRLIRETMRIVKAMGYDRMYLHAREEHIRRLIEYYFRTKPFTKTATHWWYLVEVK